MPLVGFGSVSSFDRICHRRFRTFKAMSILHRQYALVATLLFLAGSMLLLANAAQSDRDGGLPRPRRALVGSHCYSQSNLNLAPMSTRLERFEFIRGGESLAQDQSNIPDEDVEDQQQQLLLDEFRSALRQRLARDRTTLAQTWAALEQDLLEQRRNNHTNAKTTTENTTFATTNTVSTAPENVSSESLCTMDEAAGGAVDPADEDDATLFRPRWFGWGRQNIALRDKQRPRAVVSNSTTTTMNEEMGKGVDQSNIKSITTASVNAGATISVASVDGGSFKDPFPIRVKKGKRKTLVSDLGMEWSYPPDPTTVAATSTDNETDEANEDGTDVSSVRTELPPTTATQRAVLVAVRVVVQFAVWAILILCAVWVGQVVHSLLFGIGTWMSAARVSSPPVPAPAPSRKQKLADSQSSASAAAATAAPLTQRLLNKLQRR
jgi:hypothetical protein